jgi:hypothetical protein
LLDLNFKAVSIGAHSRSSRPGPQSRSPAENTKQPNKQQPNKTKQYIAVKGVYMKKFIRTLTCLCVIAACGTTFAQHGKLQSGPYKGPMGPVPAAAPEVPEVTFFTNLQVDSCTGFQYSADNGFLLIGPSNCGLPGSTQWLAAPFISRATGAVTKVRMAITNWGICTPTSNKFTVQIYDDACAGVPNLPLGSAVQATAAAAPPGFANANFAAAGVSLTAGNHYWVVVTTNASPAQIGTTAVWWEATGANEPYNLDDGNGWNTGFLGGVGGFAVQ